MTRLVIFDLDGTLLNTIADLGVATNHALRTLGYPLHTDMEYIRMVGGGINKLLERALPDDCRTEENVLRMREVFLPHYDLHNADLTTPYPGMVSLLARLQDDGRLLAVASNKYQKATDKLVAHYFPTIHFASVLGQREGIPVKPDPTIVYDILREAGDVAREDVLYIGDSGTDMQTAHNAGVRACGVTWGFRPREELSTFHPAHLVDSPEEILQLLVPWPRTCALRT